jgi:CHASE3 domain sensor protein
MSGKLLWDDDDIEEAVLLIENRFGTEASMMAAKELRSMRSEYEARIQVLAKRLKAYMERAARPSAQE